jgi:hypothetical protein
MFKVHRFPLDDEDCLSGKYTVELLNKNGIQVKVMERK